MRKNALRSVMSVQKDKKVVKRKVEPQAILFSEFYFYLAANIEGIDKEKAFDVAMMRFQPFTGS